VRLLVQRERARRAFRSGSYWDLKARLEEGEAGFEVKLSQWTVVECSGQLGHLGLSSAVGPADAIKR
jgi:DNA topoisomerase IA